MKNENNYLTHGIHPYHAKFIPSIPIEYLEKYTNKGDYVLDPFCGSGTTLLECMLNERKSVGVDMNEIAYRISRAKTFVPNLQKLEKYYFQIIEKFDKIQLKKTIQFDSKYIWYTKHIADELDKLIASINTIKEEDYRNLFLVIISSIAKTVSNKRKTWNNGYIADNVLPNVKYKGSAFTQFKNKYIKVYKSYQELVNTNISKKYAPKIYNKDINDYQTKIKFDAVITSPPYPFAVDFVKYNRLSFYWLGIDVDVASEKETGARAKRSKKNASKDFFDEMEKIYLHLFKMIKTGGYFCMTVANTQRKNETVNFLDWLDTIFVSNGWVLVDNTKRRLQNQSMGQKRIPIENKLVYRKIK